MIYYDRIGRNPMAEFISEQQLSMLKQLGMTESQIEEFMGSFKGTQKFNKACSCFLTGMPPRIFDSTREHICKCGQSKSIANRMLQLIQEHPFWGQTIEVFDHIQKKMVTKYKYITNPSKPTVQTRPFNHWKTPPITWKFGGYFCKEPIFQINNTTGELYSITNSYQVHGQLEKHFITRLNKFQEKLQLQFNNNTKDWQDFDVKELMVVTS